MNIAFISYEYPPDTADGGIATYVEQAASMMTQRGHHVEVFAGTRRDASVREHDGITVHRIHETDPRTFSNKVGSIFQKRHSEVQFDVIEGPEYHADAQEAVRLVPDIALVVKLHTPSYLLYRMNNPGSSIKKIRAYLGAVRRGTHPPWHPRWRDECSHALEADIISAPCMAIGNLVSKDWGLASDRVMCVPYPYVPAPSLLQIPVETTTSMITYLGRLEMRKGVLDFARSIPCILRRNPSARFRFVGRPTPSPRKGVDMQQYLQQTLAPHLEAVKFIGGVPPEKIPQILAGTDICVFPSHWENFPNVCLESMTAGRAVVGSNAGGMVEMLADGECGVLISPHKPEQIAAAVLRLLNDPGLRIRFGGAARQRVLSEYNLEVIGTLQEDCYTQAIKRRRELGRRQVR